MSKKELDTEDPTDPLNVLDTNTNVDCIKKETIEDDGKDRKDLVTSQVQYQGYKQIYILIL